MHRLIEEIGETSNEATWGRVLSRCQSHSHEAAHLDRRGGSCLHAACSKNPPVSVVQAILQACRRNGEVVLERDKSGRTPLMIAISSSADLELIETLLKSSQRAASVRDHLGHLPLHLASIRFDNDQDALIRLLLNIFPEAAGRESNNGQTSLQCAIEAEASASVVELLVEGMWTRTISQTGKPTHGSHFQILNDAWTACPDAVAKDGNGLNPLFLAIRRNAGVEIIRCLVTASPHSTHTRDRGDGLPLRRAIEMQCSIEILECLCTSKLTVLDADKNIHNTALHGSLECGTAKEDIVRLLIRVAPEVAVARNTVRQTPLSLASQRFLGLRWNRRSQASVDQLWNIVVILMRAAYYGVPPDDDSLETPTLHAAIGLSQSLEIVTAAFDFYPEQASMRDKHGHYPLWLAIQYSPSSHRRDVILRALGLFPTAAQIPDPNGRFVLTLAAEQGVDGDILHQLWQAHPDAGKQLDPLHRLFPFQVAALPNAPNFSDLTLRYPNPTTKLQNDLNQLSAIFELLLSDPSLLLSAGHDQS
jgi:ankyrin repeat protein